MLNKMQLKWKLICGFSLILGLVVPISVTTNNSLNSLIESSGLVNHTQKAIEYSAELGAAMVDMETGLRGFLVAGHNDFLEPYYGGQGAFDETMEAVLLHVSDNPEQVARLEEIDQLKSNWLRNHAQVAIGMRREVVEGAAATSHFNEVSARTVGKDRFDGFRAEMADVEAVFSAAGDQHGLFLVQAIIMDMVNQETGQRGFLLTGVEESLEPYVAGSEKFDADTQTLQAYISANSQFSAARSGLQSAIDLSYQWSSDAAEPEIDARREMNQFPTTLGDVTTFVESGVGKRSMDTIRGILQEFSGAERVLIDVRNASASATADFAKDATVYGALLLLVIGVLVTFFITRNVLKQLGADPSRVQAVARAIASGDLTKPADVGAKPTGVYLAMDEMRENLIQRNDVDKAQMAETSRVKQALDTAKANVMVADAENKIIYINNATASLFKKLEAEIIREIPGFNASDLVGKSMDVFHKNPAHQQSMVSKLQSNHEALISIGTLKLNLAMVPILGEDGEREGTVVEWLDRTAELAIENEVSGIVQSALEGDLSQRVSLDGKTGFLRMLSEGINDLVNVCDQAVADTIKVLGGLSSGDLTEKIERDYKGAFGTLKEYTNTTVDKLTEVVTSIKDSSELVATGSQELSLGNHNLSRRTEEQASSLEETSSSMEEMTSTVQQNAQNAKEADRLAQGAKEKAEHGGKVVSEAVTAMDEISGASKRIFDIIGVIDEIAFQTNLLALNASVEAARAGEQGRGFAVVASEVRNLAGRSATAAKEIKELIEDTVQKVEEGSKLVDESGKTLNEIIDAVQNVTHIVADISSASLQQASGIEEVNKAITLMDDMTQQNAALVEQAAAASEAMGGQANELKNQIAFFTVAAGSDHTVTAKKAPAISAVTEIGPVISPKKKPPAPLPAASSEWEEF